MAKNIKKKTTDLSKVDKVKMNKISVFYRRSVLKQILKILTMEHGGFRTFKSVKNINRLFNNIDLTKYKGNAELEAYIWCICYFSKEWLDGIVSPDIIAEMAKARPDYTDIAGDIIKLSLEDKHTVTAPEAKALFDLISEALQYGYVASMKDEYINLLEDIDPTEPGAIKQIVERLFLVSQSLLDIKHNTNMVANKIEFNTADIDSVREGISATISSLQSSNNIFKVGIKRWNTLLSPAYMNGRLYVYCGIAGSGKSLVLLKSALDIRKYNPNFRPRTPGMKPCVLYISMENTFTETIERIWNMCFDDPILNYSEEEALDKICMELGIAKVLKDDVTAYELDDIGNKTKKIDADVVQENRETGLATLESLLDSNDSKNDYINIEIVMQYYPYRSISTDDLFTIIQDLRDENMEVCAFVFDYIKRIEPATPIADNERLELDRITNELKALAVIQDIPVITAHQLNRLAASKVDEASRKGKTDLIRETGRDNIGNAWSVYEVADWVGIVGTEYRPGTDEKFFTLEAVKRRRIDAAESDMAKYTYLAHPFAKNNGLRLVDDINLDKVLSLQSLSSDINMIGVNAEKANAIPRLQTMKPSEFIEDY